MACDFLMFRLFGPLASWGGVAVAGERPTHTHPTKSALLGLVAGALGVVRTDEQAFADLEAGYGLASRAETVGTPLRDYHTVQTPAGKKAARATRRDELRLAENVRTILSSRDYLTDAAWTVCLWQRDPEARWSLAEMAQALERPVFSPYLGRKSCPPCLPLAARIVAAETIAQAFEDVSFPDTEWLGLLPRPRWLGVCYDRPIPGDPEPGLEAGSDVIRRDAVISRARWQFGSRVERQARMAGGDR